MSISLDNVKMNVIKTSPKGVVNDLTIFTFSQNGNFVSAIYEGGKIYKGYLVGTVDNFKLSFSYCQLQNDGKIDNGHSECDITINREGKIILTEHFTWASKNDETGINIFQEL
jgi:hypothetical protein